MGGIFLRRLEGDVVTETWRLDHHEVRAGGGFFDQRDAVGSDRRVAVVLQVFVSMVAPKTAHATLLT